MVRVILRSTVTVNEGCIAIACPITGDWVAMTNHTFSIAEMKRNLGFAHLEIINDFTAVSMAIPMLKAEHLIQFGGSAPVAGKPIAVYGAGTGSAWRIWSTLISVGSACRAKAVMLILPRTAKKKDHSGRATRRAGACFRRTRALRSRAGQPVSRDCQSDGRLPENLQPREVTERALADSCTDCRRALSLFCVIMGRFGGNPR